jgi:2-oxoglutarate ferredoxin oxidoreductase subunit delta
MSTDVNSRGFRYPRLRPGCTGCAACVMVCPDFCFEIYKFATPTQHTVDVADETAGGAQ